MGVGGPPEVVKPAHAVKKPMPSVVGFPGYLNKACGERSARSQGNKFVNRPKEIPWIILRSFTKVRDLILTWAA